MEPLWCWSWGRESSEDADRWVAFRLCRCGAGRQVGGQGLLTLRLSHPLQDLASLCCAAWPCTVGLQQPSCLSPLSSQITGPYTAPGSVDPGDSVVRSVSSPRVSLNIVESILSCSLVSQERHSDSSTGENDGPLTL